MPLQVVQPRIRGFVSVSSHPDGCAANVRRQIEVASAGLAEARPAGRLGPTLVVGSSTGYGLGSMLSACFGLDAPVLGVCFERPAERERTATAGWYNLAEAHRLAKADGRHLETINADAYQESTKDAVVEALRARYLDGVAKLELFIYSLAAPRRFGAGGQRWESVLKPIGAPFTGKTIDQRNHAIVDASLEAATPEEIEATIKVMGGEDWARWVERLQDADVLAPGFRTVAYSYVGPRVTQEIYRSGTIGRAKQHLEASAVELTRRLAPLEGQALVSVNEGVVTQASAAIPGVSLYISLLMRVMKARGTHEGTIEQIVRLFHDHLAPGATPRLDDGGLIRLDDRELDPAVQAEVDAVWDRLETANMQKYADYEGYQRAFAALFGFGIDGIDYDAPTEVDRSLV
ncbi:MAG: trans-2-enoyl-CoA reductase family protein [Dehalococcoidia bacterium]|nr:trans-2-enoyl-CoA reductase family protein [Dehalococcoidia bacterium]